MICGKPRQVSKPRQAELLPFRAAALRALYIAKKKWFLGTPTERSAPVWKLRSCCGPARRRPARVFANNPDGLSRCRGRRDFSNIVEADLSVPVTMMYAHLVDGTVGTSVDQKVAAGTALGWAGTNGNGFALPLSEAQIHFEVRRSGRSCGSGVLVE